MGLRTVFLSILLIFLTLGTMIYCFFTSEFPSTEFNVFFWSLGCHTTHVDKMVFEIPSYIWFSTLSIAMTLFTLGFMWLPLNLHLFMFIIIPLIGFLWSPGENFFFFFFFALLGMSLIYQFRWSFPPRPVKKSLWIMLTAAIHIYLWDAKFPILAYTWWGLTIALPWFKVPNLLFLYGVACQLLLIILPAIYGDITNVFNKVIDIKSI